MPGHAVNASVATHKIMNQVKGGVDWGVAIGGILALSSIALFGGSLLRVLMAPDWSSRLAFFLEGLFSASLVGGLAGLVTIFSQILRCFYDYTYQSVAPLEDSIQKN